MSDEKESAEAPKKSKKMLMIIVIAVVLLGGGGAGAFFVFGNKSAAKPKPKPGEVVKLDAITINLSDGHYLKLGLALQATADAKEAPEGSKALDLAIAQYTDMAIGELSTTKGREKEKKELLEKVEKAYEEEVMDIYFTQFVTQ
jgi:flagellar FliL protein